MKRLRQLRVGLAAFHVKRSPASSAPLVPHLVRRGSSSLALEGRWVAFSPSTLASSSRPKSVTVVRTGGAAQSCELIDPPRGCDSRSQSCARSARTAPRSDRQPLKGEHGHHLPLLPRLRFTWNRRVRTPAAACTGRGAMPALLGACRGSRWLRRRKPAGAIDATANSRSGLEPERTAHSHLVCSERGGRSSSAMHVDLRVN